MAGKPEKTFVQTKGLHADKKFRVVRGWGKGHGACGGVGGGLGQVCTHHNMQGAVRMAPFFVLGLAEAKMRLKKFSRGDSLLQHREERLGKK